MSRVLSPLLLLSACVAGGGGYRDLPSDTADPSTTTIPGTGTTSTTTPAPFVLEVEVVTTSLAIGLRTNLPRLEADCTALTEVGAPCADADLDGLVDAWEDMVLDRFRPAVRFDESEPLIADPAAVLVDVGRVAPAEDGSGAIRAYIMIGYHEDYGRCGVSGHPGDSERVVIDLNPVGPGDVDARAFYTAAHEGTITDSGHVFLGSELLELSFPTDPGSGEPRWMVFSSDGKHATYGTAQRCEDAQWAPCLEEDCEADGVDPLAFTRLPDVHNAGEEAAPFLTDLGPIGFPGEDAWADQDFCGGLGSGLFGCASAVREKLLVDPF